MTKKTCSQCGKDFTGRGPSVYCSDDCYFLGHIDKTPGHGPDGDCWIWSGYTAARNGYGTLGRHDYAHRHAYKLAYGDPGTLNVLHRCDNPRCCRPDHLWLGSAYDNWQDAVAKGRMKIAVPKLTPAEVQAIRSSSETVRELARQHQVAAPTIRAILRGRSWRHLVDDVPVAAE